MIATSQLDPSPAPRTLLFLQDVPAGAYRVHVMRKADAGGELTLGIGHGHVPAGHWRLAHDSGDSFPLDLPLLVSTLALSGDEEAVRGIERVVLSPTVHGAAPPTTEAYARDAARYGSRMVYALDDRVWLESGGFWLMGAQQPEVLVTADDDAVRVLELHLQNGPVRNAVRLRAAAWSDGRTLTPDERWTVHVPVADPRRGVVVAFDVERAFRPVDWDRDSRDRRALGCFVQVE